MVKKNESFVKSSTYKFVLLIVYTILKVLNYKKIDLWIDVTTPLEQIKQIGLDKLNGRNSMIRKSDCIGQLTIIDCV